MKKSFSILKLLSRNAVKKTLSFIRQSRYKTILLFGDTIISAELIKELKKENSKYFIVLMDNYSEPRYKDDIYLVPRYYYDLPYIELALITSRHLANDKKRKLETYLSCPVVSLHDLSFKSWPELLSEHRKNYQYYKTLTFEQIKEEIKIIYHDKTGEDLNFEKPQNINQCFQLEKISGDLAFKRRCADKYLVRDYVAQKIGANYLIPLLGVYDTPDQIDFSKLPLSFVLKCNHGSGMNILVHNKNKTDYKLIKKKLQHWLSIDYSLTGFEMQYSGIERKILCEPMLTNEGHELYDYKFWCFNGKVEYINFLSDRFSQGGLKMAFYNKDWIKQDFYYSYIFDDSFMPRPDNLDKMIEIAENLSSGFRFVRVDLYRLDNGKLYFGELTFNPNSGFMDWNDENINKSLASLYFRTLS